MGQSARRERAKWREWRERREKAAEKSEAEARAAERAAVAADKAEERKKEIDAILDRAGGRVSQAYGNGARIDCFALPFGFDGRLTSRALPSAPSFSFPGRRSANAAIN